MGIIDNRKFSMHRILIFRNICGLLVILCTACFLAPSVVLANSNKTTEHTLRAQYLAARERFKSLKTDKYASRNDWLENAQDFQIAYLSNPGAPFAPKCLFMLGRSYREMYERFHNLKDLKNSIIFFNDTASLFPENSLADDSLMAVADMTLNDLHNPRKATQILKRIVTDFPHGDMHKLALKKLDHLSRKYNLPLTESHSIAPPPKKLMHVLPVKYWSSSDYTRVVINASGPVAYKDKLLKKSEGKPHRLVIDFSRSYVQPRYRVPVPIKQGLLKRIHTSQYGSDTVRVELDMESVSSYNIFSLVDPFRVIVDIRGRQRSKPLITKAPSPKTKPAQARGIVKKHPAPNGHKPATANPPAENSASVKTPVAAAAPESPPAKTITVKEAPSKPAVFTPAPAKIKLDSKTGSAIVVLRDSRKIAPKTAEKEVEETRIPVIPGSGKPLSLAQQLGLRVKTIVLDPGHGGKDPGAMANGLKEKDIVLKVAKKLAPILRKNLGCRVILTRSTDVFIPLEERTAIANKNDADLFVSLHINADPVPKASGFETYYLNLTSNPEAMRVAAYENATSTHQMSDLHNILSTILKNSKIKESSRLAEQVHKAMVHGLEKDYTHIKDMGVRKAPFYVLIGAEMPAILVEMSFITNKVDAKHLKNNRFLTCIADNISSGIQSYIHNNTAGIHLSFTRK